ncbi:MAG: hypothetical protein ACM3OO_03710 [Planctomycetaceae bacterium]
MNDLEGRLRTAFRDHEGSRLSPGLPDPEVLRRARRGRILTTGLAVVLVLVLVGASVGVVRSLRPPQIPAPADRITLPTGDTATIVGGGITQDGREWRVVILTGGAWAATSAGGVLARLELRDPSATQGWQPIEVERFSKISGPIDAAGMQLSDVLPGSPWSTIVTYGVVRGDVTVALSRDGATRSKTQSVVALPPTGSTISGAFTFATSSAQQWRASVTDARGNVWGHPFEQPTASDVPSMGSGRQVVSTTRLGSHTYGIEGYVTDGVDEVVECVTLRLDGRPVANRCASVGREPQVWSYPTSDGGTIVFGTVPRGFSSVRREASGRPLPGVGGEHYFVASTTDPCIAPFVFQGPAGSLVLPSAQDCPLPGGA